MDTLDCRGLKCPLPVLRLEKRIAMMAPAEAVLVLSTDPVAKIDIPLFCTRNGHGCEPVARTDSVLAYRVTKRKNPA